MAGVKVFDPRRDPVGRIALTQWQLCAMAFDERADTLRTINWPLDDDGANLEVLAAAGGSPRPGPRLAVTNRIAYPRGDFAFGPDGRQLAAPRNGDDSAVGVWDAVTGREVATLRAPGTVTALAFGAGGTRLAIAAWDRRHIQEVAIWDLATGRVIQTIDAGPRPIRAVAFSADGGRVAAGGGDVQSADSGWAGAWNAETGASLVTLDRAGIIMALAFHPDGSRLAAADFGDQILHLWDLAAGTEVRQPAPAAVSCLAFTPDGSRLASVGYDGQVHLADARTGQELLVLRSAAGPRHHGYGFTPRLTFSRDGSRLAANGVWDVSFWEIGPPSRPEAAPAPAEVAGWLRQGRALAKKGDDPGALAAYARAWQFKEDDPSPWIEHALALYRRGDSRSAKDALDLAISSLPDDSGHWVDLGRFARTVRPDQGVRDHLAQGPGPRRRTACATPPTTRRPPRSWRCCCPGSR